MPITPVPLPVSTPARRFLSALLGALAGTALAWLLLRLGLTGGAVVTGLLAAAGAGLALLVLARQADRAAQAMYQRQLEMAIHAQHPLALIDARGHVAWGNGALARLCAVPVRQLPGQPLTELLQCQGSEAGAALQAALDQGHAWRGELPCRTADGRAYWIDVELQTFQRKTGLPLQHTLLAIDVTARLEADRQRQDALQQLDVERARLDRILEGTRAGTWEYNPQTRQVLVNAQWATMLGYTLQELQPFTMERSMSMIHPDDHVAALRMTNDVLRGVQAHFLLEQRLRHRDGHWVWMQSRAAVTARSADGRALWLAGVHIDITERKAQEQALEQQRRKLRTVIDSLPGVVFECELQGDGGFHFGFISESLRSTFGLVPAEVMADARVLFRDVDPADLPALQATVQASARDGSPCRLELRIGRGDGLRWAALHSLPTRREDGRTVWHGMLLDITERKRLDVQLQQTTARAEEANRAKSAFLAAMSHEIRTPMNGVMGMAELLTHARDPEDLREAARTIHQSAQGLLGIVDDILDFSKIEAGRIDLERLPVDLQALAQGVCDTLGADNASRPVSLRLFVSPALPGRVWADPTRLRQVLTNLVGNAMKFCRGLPDRRGQVAVRLLPLDAGHALAPGLLLQVRDNGIGMSAETVERLFTPFSQAEASTTRRFGGTGLGLAITHRLVQLMGGQLQVSSAPDQGATFSVTLPLQPAPCEAPADAQLLAGLACITLADSAEAQADLREHLLAGGAQVAAASDLADAAWLARHQAAAQAGPVVVVHDSRPRPAPDGLRSAFAGAGDVRHLLLGGQRLGPARVVAPDLVRLGALQPQALRRAVALAAGRLSPELLPRPARPAGLPPLVTEEPAPRVLVVEDDPTSREVALRQLQLLGLQAEAACDALEALALWRHQPFALLLTDLHMPGMDGYELVRTLRAEAAAGDRRPMLALTANALQGEAARALQAGMDDCLTKPITLAALHGALSRWLGARPTPPAAPTDGPAAAASALPAAPVLDRRVLVRMLGDDPAAVREFLQLFHRSAQTQAQDLQRAFDGADAAEVARAAHKFKSMARSVGALALGDVCAEIEAAAARAGAADFAAQQGRFNAALAAALQAAGAAIDEGQPHTATTAGAAT